MKDCRGRNGKERVGRKGSQHNSKDTSRNGVGDNQKESGFVFHNISLN